MRPLAPRGANQPGSSRAPCSSDCAKFSAVPGELRDYVAGFKTMIAAGGYVFVHAGIDPARPLAEQERGDLLWIR